MNKQKMPQLGELYEALLTLRSAEECRLFLEDICTVKELQSMAQRLEVAKLLMQGKNYNTVCADTGASSTTVSRVNRCLLYGNGGYRTVLQRQGKEQSNGD